MGRSVSVDQWSVWIAGGADKVCKCARLVRLDGQRLRPWHAAQHDAARQPQTRHAAPLGASIHHTVCHSAHRLPSLLHSFAWPPADPKQPLAAHKRYSCRQHPTSNMPARIAALHLTSAATAVPCRLAARRPLVAAPAARAGTRSAAAAANASSSGSGSSGGGYQQPLTNQERKAKRAESQRLGKQVRVVTLPRHFPAFDSTCGSQKDMHCMPAARGSTAFPRLPLNLRPPTCLPRLPNNCLGWAAAPSSLPTVPWAPAVAPCCSFARSTWGRRG